MSSFTNFVTQSYLKNNQNISQCTIHSQVLELSIPPPRHILAVSCMQQLHACGCPFQKYFQILYIFAQILNILPFLPFFCSFSEKSHACSYVLEQALLPPKFIEVRLSDKPIKHSVSVSKVLDSQRKIELPRILKGCRCPLRKEEEKGNQ